MIGIFLDPYPDEIMYSTIARNAAAMNYPNLRSVGVTYFGDPQIIATVALPCRMEYLVTHLPLGSVHTVDTLIDAHTLLPFFAPFLPPTRVAALRYDMCGTHGMGVYMRAGVMASTVPMPNALRLCPICAEEDKMQCGEWYWHRLHQTPGVYVCSRHQVWLEDSLVLITNRQTRHIYIAAESSITHLPLSRTVVSTSYEDTLLAIAQAIQWIFEQAPEPLGLEQLQKQYVRALIKCDLATFSGRVRISEVIEAFTSFYSKEILTLLHCTLNVQSQDNWLARLVRKPDSALHPIHHLLLIHFLGGDIADYLLAHKEAYTPFNGPWPCLNPVCIHYNTNVIKTCSITYPSALNGRPSGSFYCESCGFTYGRVGPDQGNEDVFRRGKIIAVGQVWENALRQCWIDPSLSVNMIAKRLGVDPVTVKRHAQRLGLNMVRTDRKKALIVTPKKMLKAEYPVDLVQKLQFSMQSSWLEACNTHGHLGRKAVRQQAQSVYTWLYRHDRKWLEQHSPPRKSPKPPQRIDWARRDLEISHLIPETAHKLQTQPGPPYRVTIAAVGRAIGCLPMIQQHLNLLPLTAVALEEVEETQVAFTIRRIHWNAAYLQEQGQVKRWELIRLSGVGKKLLLNKDIQDALSLAINEVRQSEGTLLGFRSQ